jgi:hypothetical protein
MRSTLEQFSNSKFMNLILGKQKSSQRFRKCVPHKILRGLTCLGACSEVVQITSSEGSNIRGSSIKIDI